MTDGSKYDATWLLDQIREMIEKLKDPLPPHFVGSIEDMTWEVVDHWREIGLPQRNPPVIILRKGDPGAEIKDVHVTDPDGRRKVVRFPVPATGERVTWGPSPYDPRDPEWQWHHLIIRTLEAWERHLDRLLRAHPDPKAPSSSSHTTTKSRAPRRRRGRPRVFDPEDAERIVADWKAAKKQGMKQKELETERGWAEGSIRKAQDRVRRNRERGQGGD